ncbi:hypothetical protein GCM10010371_68530 [Streptomyces subrutilus]|uniref:Uncharacterized protein n=1 Tax=Streptomyces subrutilus TaxID=36818 RepID=A0A918VGE8_9ACTN|nr:hypothetical protein GCM10010371_68530 [Streptomyces subrutilus]
MYRHRQVSTVARPTPTIAATPAAVTPSPAGSGTRRARGDRAPAPSLHQARPVEFGPQQREQGHVQAPEQGHVDFAAPGLAEVDHHPPRREKESEAGEVVDVATPQAKAHRHLVGAVEGVAVQDGGEVAAAAEGCELVGVDGRGVRRPAEAEQEAGGGEVGDRAGRHRRPQHRQRGTESGGEALGGRRRVKADVRGPRTASRSTAATSAGDHRLGPASAARHRFHR